MSSPVAVEVRLARKRWRESRVEALRGVSLEVGWGSIVGLVGPNGAGKSTLLRAIMGFTDLDSGGISIAGRGVSSLETRRITGWLPQAFPIEPRMSGGQMLAWLHELSGGSSSAFSKDVSALLEAVGLDHAVARRRASDYSGGTRQRLGIAQAFMGSPSLVVLDEPTAGLDPVGVMQLRALMHDVRDRGGSVLLSSHQLDEVARTCDSIAFLSDGVLLDESPTTAEEMERLFVSPPARPS